MNSLPLFTTRLRLWQETFDRDSSLVELREGRLVLRAIGYGCDPNVYTIVVPPAERWIVFWKKVESLGVWSDTADVTELLRELHRIVNEAIRTAAPGGDHAEGVPVDLSRIDFEKLRDEFDHKVRRKHAALQDIRVVVEEKLAQMLARNPLRMDFYKKYQAIIADYNREKDRATVEATFAQLIELAGSLDGEQRRAAEEGLTDEELALFDLLSKPNVSKADRERLKQASKALLASLRTLLQPIQDWAQKATTQAEVKIFILDTLYRSLPQPPYTEGDTEEVAARVYEYVWGRSVGGAAIAA